MLPSAACRSLSIALVALDVCVTVLHFEVLELAEGVLLLLSNPHYRLLVSLLTDVYMFNAARCNLLKIHQLQCQLSCTPH